MTVRVGRTNVTPWFRPQHNPKAPKSWALLWDHLCCHHAAFGAELQRRMSPSLVYQYFQLWDNTHHKHCCKPHWGGPGMVLIPKDHCGCSGPVLFKRQLCWSFYLQHEEVNVTRYSLKVSERELLWWHAKAERNGSDLQATACQHINPFIHTIMHVSRG